MLAVRRHQKFYAFSHFFVQKQIVFHVDCYAMLFASIIMFSLNLVVNVLFILLSAFFSLCKYVFSFVDFSTFLI